MYESAFLVDVCQPNKRTSYVKPFSTQMNTITLSLFNTHLLKYYKMHSNAICDVLELFYDNGRIVLYNNDSTSCRMYENVLTKR